jgi:tRNA(Arg) A34 adenosine deaminase TadA
LHRLWQKQLPQATDLPPPGLDPTAAQMISNLRRANKVAAGALEQGHYPFGAILVAADHETVLLEQGNINAVNHAESTLARLASEQFSEAELWTMTLFSTAEPCMMCAGTQYWANIGRLVYGMSECQLLDLTGSSNDNPTLDVPFSRGQKAIRVWGPVDEVVDEIAQFWK